MAVGTMSCTAWPSGTDRPEHRQLDLVHAGHLDGVPEHLTDGDAGAEADAVEGEGVLDGRHTCDITRVWP